MFNKVLIANRGEIAVRVIRACRQLGIATVAVHSDIDADALHVRLADEAVCIGPADATLSYLNVPGIISAAEISGAQAIHPGYGFLSENAEFARTCEQCGLAFVGPRPEQMERWGNKLAARALAKDLGLTVVEGSEELEDQAHALRVAKKMGYPLMLKAAAGGGGRGMKVVTNDDELSRVFEQAQSEAVAGFGNGALYFETYIEKPRHIEFQVLGDGRGRVAVLGERECSIQRRHQKLLEEAPCVAVSDELRGDMTATITRALSERGYMSAGTLEFLMDAKGNLAFLEMNTRIQVEHPITEAVTGVDLVAEQLLVAAGQSMSLPNKVLAPRGHAIECRLNAEDPVTFAPSPGRVTEYHPPGGAGIRIDDGIYGGCQVPPHYDSLLLKVIAHGRDRDEALRRMKRALTETIIGGVRTNIALHQDILEHPDFVAGDLDTDFVRRLRLT